MPVKLSHLSPNYILDKIDKRCPRFKAFRGNPKVQKIAGHAFKALACIVFGAGLGALVISPLGPGLAVGIGVGIAMGALSYFAVASVLFVLRRYGFPAHRFRTSPPLGKDQWFSDKNYKKFQTILAEKIFKLDCFKEWKQVNNITSDDKAKKKLWKECQKGFCQSEAQNLISLLKDDPTVTGQGLLNKIETEDLFHRQLLEIIRADLPNTQEIEDLAQSISHAEAFLHKSFTKNEMRNDPLLLNNLRKELKETGKYQAIALTIRLQNNHDDAHTLFVQLYPIFRFYDPYNPVFTGFHEGFKTKGQLLKTLQRHILGYHSKTRPTALRFDEMIIRAYRIDCPDQRQQHTTVTAGAIPAGSH